MVEGSIHMQQKFQINKWWAWVFIILYACNMQTSGYNSLGHEYLEHIDRYAQDACKIL